jgi:membrane-associated phospholipid phosphatase
MVLDKVTSSILFYGGDYGPQLLFALSLVLLFDKGTMLGVYVIGMIMCIFANVVLKSLIQQPRPLEDPRLFNLEVANPNRHIGFDRYGMPSGHGQSVFFSFVFVTLVTKNKWISLFYGVICALTSWQRVFYNQHTCSQVLVGAMVGCSFALFFYFYGKEILKGAIKAKKDDDAPFF